MVLSDFELYEMCHSHVAYSSIDDINGKKQITTNC